MSMPRKRRGASKRNSAWVGTFVEAAGDETFVEAICDDEFAEVVCDDAFVEAVGDDVLAEAGCEDAFASARWKVPNFPNGAEIFQMPTPQSKRFEG